ncbi:MAG: hypothetical protein UR68_C0009G0011 [Candidatus Roizmanbacteria bacterium GW2011_GWA2_35_19]|uniref:Uncharacterized protein n=2 Tax=Candidatus Roizmaniibacteriota TaxID=1752723 RepID=A0A0G0CA94_9BACT|nr:MAG: hypothetical protein UR63_C0004G0011 [Candidatus Roizmanbacteria bacterium GW2011_GWC2_35_12]KKP73066.1 MAG: hypothetical protein UR68_C0009G0011 [Candidatus Roizmanbacteria bacterium GW2011_GWA2_35_19]
MRIHNTKYYSERDREMIGASSSESSFLPERKKMFQNYRKVIKYAINLVNSERSKYIKGDLKSAFNLLNDSIEYICPEDETRHADLIKHREDVNKSASSLRDVLKQIKVEESLLNDHQMDLLVDYVAPLHDRGKYLVSFDGQIDSDHQILMGLLIRKVFALLDIDKKDIDFIAGVVGDHENVGKEIARQGFIDSSDPIERAKAIFLIFDVLTNAVDAEKITDKQILSLDSENLKRFADIIYRHTDPRQATTFYPDWAVYTVEDLAHILTIISQKYNLRLESGIFEVLFQNVAKGLQDLILQNNARRIENISTEKLSKFSRSVNVPIFPLFREDEETHIKELIEKINGLNERYETQEKELTINLLKSRLRSIVGSFFDPEYGTGYKLAKEASHETWGAVRKFFTDKNFGKFEDELDTDKGNNVGNVFLTASYLFEKINEKVTQDEWIKTVSKWHNQEGSITQKLNNNHLVYDFVMELAILVHNSYAYSKSDYNDLWSNTKDINMRQSFITTVAITNGLLEELYQTQIDNKEPDKLYAIKDEEDIEKLCLMNILTDPAKKSLIRIWDSIAKDKDPTANIFERAAKFVHKKWSSKKEYPITEYEDLNNREKEINRRSVAAQFNLLIEQVVFPSNSPQDLVDRLEDIIARIFINNNQLDNISDILERQARIGHAFWLIQILITKGLEEFKLNPERLRQLVLYDDLPNEKSSGIEHPALQGDDRLVVASSTLVFLTEFIEKILENYQGISLVVNDSIKKLVVEEGLVPKNNRFNWEE